MPLPEPQPCMSQDCLFQKVTARGQYSEMASRTSQAEFSHRSQKSDESKKWFCMHKNIDVPHFWHRSRQAGHGEGERGRNESRGDLCVHEEWGWIPSPSVWADLTTALSLLQMSCPAGYKTNSPVTVTHLGHHITTQPGLHTMGPESNSATSPKIPGKALHSISLSKTKNHNCRNNMIISIYKTN